MQERRELELPLKMVLMTYKRSSRPSSNINLSSNLVRKGQACRTENIGFQTTHRPPGGAKSVGLARIQFIGTSGVCSPRSVFFDKRDFSIHA